MPKFYDQFLSAGTDLAGNDTPVAGLVGDTPILGVVISQVTSPPNYWTNDVIGQPVDPWLTLGISQLTLVWRAGVGLRAFVYGKSGLNAQNIGTLAYDHALNDPAINSATELKGVDFYSWPGSTPPAAGTPSLLVYVRNQASELRRWAITATTATAF